MKTKNIKGLRIVKDSEDEHTETNSETFWFLRCASYKKLLLRFITQTNQNTRYNNIELIDEVIVLLQRVFSDATLAQRRWNNQGHTA